jgi:branched-chain amino acid transport system substrate-binding protein
MRYYKQKQSVHGHFQEGKMKRLVWVAIFMTVLIFTGFSSASSAENIKVGAILRLSQGATDGLPAKRGIEIAVKQINAKGGINGKNLVVIYEDSKDSDPTAVAAYQKLISIDKCQVIIGPMKSSEVLAVATGAQRDKIVIITPTGTSPKISQAGEYIYRGCTTSEKQAEALTRYAKEKMKTTSVAILYSNEPYGKGCNDTFTKNFTALGIPVVISESFMVGDKEFSAQLSNIKAKKFDLLFIPGYLQETAQAIKQARQIGIKAASMGVYGDMSPKYIELAGKAADGHINCSEYNKEYNTPTNMIFKKEYDKIVKTNANDPNNIMFAAITYDMTRLIADAVAKKGNNADDIRAYLDTVKDFDGVTGKLSFDKEGDVNKQGVYLFKVEKGRYVKVE